MTFGYALLVDLSYTDAPLENGVYCFGTEAEAVQFAIESLIKGGELSRNEDGKLIVGTRDPEPFNADEDALEAFQYSLDTHDYFHVREVKRLPEQSKPSGPNALTGEDEWRHLSA